MRALILLLPAALAIGCFAEGRCLTQADCPSGQTCIDGECRHPCYEDEDCNPPYLCKDHQCKLPTACVGCSFEHAEAVCDETTCAMGACESGWWNHNGLEDDGCEYGCVPTGEETCNEVDDDCDGKTDEDWDLLIDVDHCGDCDTVCTAGDNAVPLCAAGACTYTCEEGWYDNDGLAENGCEAEECEPVTEGPVDVEPNCDGKDDDCDGEVDEGWDLTAPESCGPLCLDCTALFPNAAAICAEGGCTMGDCLDDWVDANDDSKDGCECQLTNGGVETCDGLDNDCNGGIDDGLNCCPEGMVQVDPAADCIPEVTKPFCIDKYEASVWQNPDCTGDSYGTDPMPNLMVLCNWPEGFPFEVGQGGMAEETPVYACSLKDVYPTRCVSWYQADRACKNSGKRLCTPEEWQLACHGTGCNVYPFGDEFTWDVCNYIQTHEEGWFLLPTGSMEGCQSNYGVVDISGNVWEYDAAAGGRARGGAYNCNQAGAPTLESCEHVQIFQDLIPDDIPKGYRNNVGFRCCK